METMYPDAQAIAAHAGLRVYPGFKTTHFGVTSPNTQNSTAPFFSSNCQMPFGPNTACPCRFAARVNIIVDRALKASAKLSEKGSETAPRHPSEERRLLDSLYSDLHSRIVLFLLSNTRARYSSSLVSTLYTMLSGIMAKSAAHAALTYVREVNKTIDLMSCLDMPSLPITERVSKPMH